LEHEAYGAVFDIRPGEVSALDDLEGLGNGYYKEQLQVVTNGELVSVFTYLASSSHLITTLRPYDWYKGLVLAGARQHAFPGSYIDCIRSWPSQRDYDYARRRKNEDLLMELGA
jgi:hypothetical protein